MRLTPIEIRAHRFNSRLRGYDTVEVQAFLDTVVEDFEDVVRENAQLRRETERLERELDSHRTREHSIQETLVTAQQMVEDLKLTAAKEAEVKVSEATLRAERLLGEADSNRSELMLELTEMRRLRTRLSSALRQALRRYEELIDSFEEADRASSEAVAPDPAIQTALRR